MNKNKINSFYNNNAPIKLTEGRKLKLHAECWGLLTEYYLESVKITNLRGILISTATLRITDRSGQVTCIIKGPSIGLLFGLTATEWVEVEKMCGSRDQLFYRYFKNGLNKNFSIEQKLFYNFCMSCQKHNVLVAKFKRCVNTRNKFKSDALLEILELKPCDTSLLDLFVDQLKIKSVNVQ